MIINSTKSLFTYTNKETLNLVHAPSIDEKNLYTEYYNFINSVLVIYGDQRADGTIPVFWTRIKNNETLEREADPNSTLKELKYNESYYIHIVDSSRLPIKIPQPIDANKFLNLEIIGSTGSCFGNLCDTTIVLSSDSHRTISLNSETGPITNIHIPISGLLPNKNYTFNIDSIYSNWPNKLTKISGTILRNSPLDSQGSVKSSIDTKFLYLYIDGKNNFNNSLPYSIIDTAESNHSKNIFSVFSLKVYDENNNLKLSDTINITCDTCVPTPTFIPSPTPTPSTTKTATPTPTPTIGSSPTPPPTQDVTPTPTPTPTMDESLRRCPYVDIKNKNLILTDKNYTELVVDFFYLNPNRDQAYEYLSNEANWPTMILPVKAPITNYDIYYENGIKYASGTINSILYFNSNINSSNNLDYEIPFYSDENFFDINKFINLKIKIGNYTNDLGFNIKLEDNGRCDICSDNITVICSGCVTDSIFKDCIEGVQININNSDIEYPPLSDSSGPTAEILVDKKCCNKNNTIYADISGLCTNKSYVYEWSSFPTIGIVPSSGLLATNSKVARINSIYNLNHNGIDNQISSLKLKIIDLNTNKYVEDNVLLRCDNGCYSTQSIPIITPTPTSTPSNPPLSFDDYIFIFIDEGFSSYVSLQDNSPGKFWNLDLIAFNNLNNNQYIDINKILIFHVISSDGLRKPIFPFINNNTYGLPIPLSRIINTPRNNPRELVNNEALTGEWIYNKVNSLVGSIGSESTVNILIDNSGSMSFSSISNGISEYESKLSSDGTKYKRILCGTERWLNWIANIYNGSSICS